MTIEEQLYQAAVVLAEKRYPTGWAGAAALFTAEGSLLTSVAPDTLNDALGLCMEVGAMLEAHKLNETVTHSICVSRQDEHSPFMILSPCGICRERLSFWGGDVRAAVSTPDNTLTFREIRELMPMHWMLAINGKVL